MGREKGVSERLEEPVECFAATGEESLVRLPVSDSVGYAIQTRGISKYPGGLPWIHNAKSGLLFGVSEDAAFIAANIVARR